MMECSCKKIIMIDFHMLIFNVNAYINLFATKNENIVKDKVTVI